VSFRREFYEKKKRNLQVFFRDFLIFFRFSRFILFLRFFKKNPRKNKKNIPADFSTGTVLFLKFRKT